MFECCTQSTQMHTCASYSVQTFLHTQAHAHIAYTNAHVHKHAHTPTHVWTHWTNRHTHTPCVSGSCLGIPIMAICLARAPERAMHKPSFRSESWATSDWALEPGPVPPKPDSCLPPPLRVLFSAFGSFCPFSRAER